MNNEIIIYPEVKQYTLVDAAKDGLRGELSDLSWAMYDQAINDFLAFIGARGVDPFGGNIAVAFSQYLKSLSDRKMKPATIKAKFSQLRRFFQWGVSVGLIDHTLLTQIQGVKVPESSGSKAHHWLSQEQMQKLLNAPDVTTALGRRDKILLALLMGCALRRSEVVNLKWGNIVQHGSAWVFENISRKHHRMQAYIPIPEWVMKIILQYGERTSDDDFILTAYDRHGNRGQVRDGVRSASLGSNAVWRIVREYGEQLGFGKLAPHDLRRSWSQVARKNGLELTQIQQMLGHASVETTQRYVNELMEIDLIAGAVELEA